MVFKEAQVVSIPYSRLLISRSKIKLLDYQFTLFFIIEIPFKDLSKIRELFHLSMLENIKYFPKGIRIFNLKNKI